MAVTAHVLECMACGHALDGPADAGAVNRLLAQPCPACKTGHLRLRGHKDSKATAVVLQCGRCKAELTVPYERPADVTARLRTPCVCGGTFLVARQA